MMLKSLTWTFTMHMAHEILLAIAAHPMAQNVIVHAAADIDRVNLDEAVVIQGGADPVQWGVEQDCAPVKAAGGFRRERERGGQHAIEHAGAGVDSSPNG